MPFSGGDPLALRARGVNTSLSISLCMRGDRGGVQAMRMEASSAVTDWSEPNSAEQQTLFHEQDCFFLPVTATSNDSRLPSPHTRCADR